MAQTPTKNARPKQRSTHACQTLDLGLEGFRECPEAGPNACVYAVPFGYGFLCNHPRLVQPGLDSEHSIHRVEPQHR